MSGHASDGPFQLPNDYELASPVFLVSPSFQFTRDITSHCIYHFSNLETVSKYVSSQHLALLAQKLVKR